VNDGTGYGTSGSLQRTSLSSEIRYLTKERHRRQRRGASSGIAACEPAEQGRRTAARQEERRHAAQARNGSERGERFAGGGKQPRNEPKEPENERRREPDREENLWSAREGGVPLAQFDEAVSAEAAEREHSRKSPFPPWACSGSAAAQCRRINGRQGNQSESCTERPEERRGVSARREVLRAEAEPVCQNGNKDREWEPNSEAAADHLTATVRFGDPALPGSNPPRDARRGYEHSPPHAATRRDTGP